LISRKNKKEPEALPKSEPISRDVVSNIQRLADRSLDAIYHYAVDQGRYFFFNQRFIQLYGLQLSKHREIKANSLLEKIHPEDRQKLQDTYAGAIASESTQGELEYRLVQSNGAIKWLLDRWIAFEEDGKPVIEGFIRDITEEKLAVEQFLDSKQNAPIGTFIVQDNRFKYVNTEFIRIVGYTEEELIETNPFDYIHEDYRDYVRLQAVAMLKGENATPYEFCVYDKSGQIRWITEAVTSVYHNGRRATLGYFMDITRLHKMQLNLSSLGLMIGTISHSLKGCLTGLDASLYLIETGFYRNKQARIEEGLDVTKLMVDRIRKLVFDILYYAKERDLQLASVDVWQFAEDVATSIETRIRAANISFTCDFPSDLGSFRIDPEILRPALINILENAMEACIEDPSDSDQVIEFNVHADDAQVIFDISDNGPGIAADQVDNIFKLFYSSKGTRGTGIGLFVTRKVIHKHGGSISVDTELGKGARFTVIMPRNLAGN